MSDPEPVWWCPECKQVLPFNKASGHRGRGKEGSLVYPPAWCPGTLIDLVAERAWLITALLEYGDHLENNCPERELYDHNSVGCICGWREIKARLIEAEHE